MQAHNFILFANTPLLEGVIAVELNFFSYQSHGRRAILIRHPGSTVPKCVCVQESTALIAQEAGVYCEGFKGSVNNPVRIDLHYHHVLC